MAMVEARAVVLCDDGVFPNSLLPALHYSGLETENARRRFESHGWLGSWVDGVYPFPHYHSTAHEALLVLMGVARLRLGGPGGIEVSVQAGDGLVLPAGVAHQNLDSSADFRVMGAYPEGHRYDMMYGRPGERPAADARIARVPLPRLDPFHGQHGPLLEHWAPAPEEAETLTVRPKIVIHPPAKATGPHPGSTFQI